MQDCSGGKVSVGRANKQGYVLGINLTANYNLMSIECHALPFKTTRKVTMIVVVSGTFAT